jgi:hypothetical protein
LRGQLGCTPFVIIIQKSDEVASGILDARVPGYCAITMSTGPN